MDFFGSTNPSARCTCSSEIWFLLSRCNDNDHSSSLLPAQIAESARSARVHGSWPSPVWRSARKNSLLVSPDKLREVDLHLCLAAWSQPSEIAGDVHQLSLRFSQVVLLLHSRHMRLVVWAQPPEVNRPCDRWSVSDASSLDYPNMIPWSLVLRSSLPSCTTPVVMEFCMLMRTTTS